MRPLRTLAWLALASVVTWAAAQPRIVSPEPDQVVHSNSGRVAVVVTGVPPGGRLLPVLDGQARGDPQPGPQVELLGVDRGTHTLEVIVIGGEADGVHTPAVTFHLFQASRLLPQRGGR